jgi:hypothetical protein
MRALIGIVIIKKGGLFNMGYTHVVLHGVALMLT